jgi:hypothetical protein
MSWIALWASVTAIGVLGLVASVNGVRFGNRVAREARAMIGTSQPAPPVSGGDLASFPLPVQRYLSKAIHGRSKPIGRARLRHGGFFRPSLSGSWLPIRGEQYFVADAPGFIWWGRVRIAPGVWIDARDRSVNGVGNMLVTFESTVTMADSRGPELDQGALTRLLGELGWLPTAFLDGRYVRWSAIDNTRAKAALTVNGRTVSAEFAFGPDDLPTTFVAERYRDIGQGRSVLTPFVGTLSDFRSVHGVLVPFRVVGAWTIDGTVFEYANFEVRQIEFD